MGSEVGDDDGLMRESIPVHQDRIVLESESDRIVLKELIPEDAQDYFDLIDSNRAHHSQYGDITAVKYPDVGFVRDSIINGDRNIKLRFGVWDEGAMVGSVNLALKKDNKGETGSWVASNHTGHNYAARARDILIKYAFQDRGLDELVSEIAVGNEASRKSVEKSGYRFNKIIVDKGMEYWVYVLSRSDWENRGK